MTFVSLPRLARFAAAAGLVALFAGLPLASLAQESSEPPPATEQTAPPPVDPAAVIATVDGVAITEADLGFVAEDLADQLSQIPQAQLRAVLLTQMIDLRLMAGAGRSAGMENTDTYKLRITYLVDRAIRRAYTKQEISDPITEAAIQAEYDRVIGSMPQEDEVHAAHILVTTEDDAKAIKAQLDAGADFTALAKEKSIEPNAAQTGGDLGYFTHDQMVAAFADAAFAMQIGQISDPVQTQFGWHIIKVEDRRPKAKPTLEAVKQQIGQQLYAQSYQALFDKLREAADIEIPDADLKAQVYEQLGIAPETPPADTSSSSAPQ